MFRNCLQTNFQIQFKKHFESLLITLSFFVDPYVPVTSSPFSSRVLLSIVLFFTNLNQTLLLLLLFNEIRCKCVESSGELQTHVWPAEHLSKWSTSLDLWFKSNNQLVGNCKSLVSPYEVWVSLAFFKEKRKNYNLILLINWIRFDRVSRSNRSKSFQFNRCRQLKWLAVSFVFPPFPHHHHHHYLLPLLFCLVSFKFGVKRSAKKLIFKLNS